MIFRYPVRRIGVEKGCGRKTSPDRTFGPQGGERSVASKSPRVRHRIFVVVAAVAVAFAAPGGMASTPKAPASRCGSMKVRPWCNTRFSPDRRADLLLHALTPDERIILLGGNIRSSPHTGASFGIPRLGIPVLYYSDGPVGPRQGKATAMPIPMALAATWDLSDAVRHGMTIATEAKLKGNDAVFAPTVNVMRTPQGGRTYEAYGEDPFLVAATTVNWIKGAQSTGVMATVKHYLANNQEGLGGAPPLLAVVGGRQVVDANVDERTLREVYMPQFEAAVKQGNTAILMCSYNRINGSYGCENQHTIQDVLEKTWGYKGFVLADYEAAHNTLNNLKNGLDFEPWPAVAYSPTAIKAVLATGLATQADVDDHVRRMLRTLFAFGFMDRAAYKNDDNQINKSADAATAQRIAENGTVLLRNEGKLLPLDKKAIHSIAVIGPYADRFVTGGGSGGVDPFAPITPLQGIRNLVGPAVTVTYDDGSNLAAAAAAAKAADVAVVVVGDVETEGQDKSCIALNCASDTENSESVLFTSTGSCTSDPCPLNGLNEDGLIAAVADANKKTVVTMETGGPVLTPWRNKVPALLEAWYPGQQSGAALARVLFGLAEPGGRLPVTFPKSPSQLPTAGSVLQYPGAGVEEVYSEGVDVGYRWYDSHQLVPAYPFGFGLSYTSFHYANLRVTRGGGAGTVAAVTADVTNTGAHTGSAVPELYLHLPAPSASINQPPEELKGYAKTSLEPGQTATVTFHLNDRSFSYFDIMSNGWLVEPGCYSVAVGSSSRDLLLHGSIGRGPVQCGKAAPSVPISATSVRLSAVIPAPADVRFHANS